ncbi:LCP family protein [Mesobacillus selenatarsenatis]|uniref:Regulatory protein MsrR n=1 Tax=Mesobacillus selenatarsenatis (strain DSM 18680 / JCM 14380 / FERM P-15431 / SF-1) TaxID=1321606 RepID=A0A0A8X423_MESS1|nr:LCP family protein [Mesobacillus selenatarsenatis]GAM14693.1 cell envelope-associated transcriptional attenuator LytR-CpsA-Psr, subfamily F1 (as in PMID19099556) [Mesobacillus selenatarsenatis SF-1]
MVLKRKKVRWSRVFLALLIIGIFMVGLNTIFQYIEGTYKAINQPFKKAEADSFHGEKDTTEEVNVLLLGSDSRGEQGARTDTIMVAHYNPQSENVKLISLMRDMYVSIPDHGKQKLNAAYSIGGTELLRKTIKMNFGLDIHHYAIVDFKGFEKAVDILVPEGIEVDIPYEMSDGIGMTLEKGTQKLHGEELLGYVRFRQDRLSDFGRVQRQQEVISKLKEEAVSLNSMTKLPDLLDLLHAHIDTNIDSPTLLAIGKDVLTNEGGEIQTIRIPEDGSFENTRLDGIGEVLEVDLAENKDALKDFLEGDRK